MKNIALILCLLSGTFAAAAEICKPEEFVDGGANPVVSISGFGYSPRCLKVPVGATITIQASGMHPVNGNAIAGNPFFNASTSASTTATQVATQPGNFIFYCIHHGTAAGEGMAGELIVQ